MTYVTQNAGENGAILASFSNSSWVYSFHFIVIFVSVRFRACVVLYNIYCSMCSEAVF